MLIAVYDDDIKKIAQENIPCFVYLFEQDGRKYFKNQIQANEINESVLGEKVNNCDKIWFSYIEIGLHSMVNNDCMNLFQSSLDMDAFNGKELPTWLRVTLNVSSPKIFEVYNAIIPKGSEYYEGTFGGRGSYVSNKLIVLEKM